jgi:hypothetical protein
MELYAVLTYSTTHTINLIHSFGIPIDHIDDHFIFLQLR